jgi:hypothetical protein
MRVFSWKWLILSEVRDCIAYSQKIHKFQWKDL